jgi:polygalacturonase
MRQIQRLLVLLILGSTTGSLAQTMDPWEILPKILEQIREPEFPKRDFRLTDFGAVDDAKTDCSPALKKAITACSEAGGGRVVVPSGRFLTGPIYLKSGVDLHLEKGAVLLFSTNPDDYLPTVPTRWEGIDLMNYAPLVYAYGETNIAMTGEGILDGQASNTHWWPWKGRKANGWKTGMPNQTLPENRSALFAMAELDKPVSERIFGTGRFLRPQFVQPYGCKNVLIEGITILNAPMWILHPVRCSNVVIRGVTVRSHGPNSDGCDPESCRNVWVRDCVFDTGDDCIAVKSGRNRDGRRIGEPSENIVFQRCTLLNGHAGIGVGSEISGGVRNLFFEDCTIKNTMWGIRLKTSSARGGVNEGIYIRNVQAEGVSEQGICMTMRYEDEGPHLPVLRDIRIENTVIAGGGKEGLVMEGYPGSPIQQVLLSNLHIDGAKVAKRMEHIREVTWKDCSINGTKLTAQ